jgi:hypothetical protein
VLRLVCFCHRCGSLEGVSFFFWPGGELDVLWWGGRAYKAAAGEFYTKAVTDRCAFNIAETTRTEHECVFNVNVEEDEASLLRRRASKPPHGRTLKPMTPKRGQNNTARTADGLIDSSIGPFTPKWTLS